MQESFQLAFIHLKSFKGGSRFSTWLSRIAINASLMKLRRKSYSRMCRWMNPPKPKSHLFGWSWKTKAWIPSNSDDIKERQRIPSRLCTSCARNGQKQSSCVPCQPFTKRPRKLWEFR